MALANKKQTKLIDKSDTNSKFYLNNDKITEMSASFANADHIESSHTFEELKPILYQLDQMQEEIDEIRRYITNEATGSAISELTGSLKVTIPTKRGATGTLYSNKGILTIS